MSRLSGLFLLAACAAVVPTSSAQTPGRLAAVGEDTARTRALAQRLRQVVGPSVVVTGFSAGSSAADVLAAKPSSILVEWGTGRTDRAAWRRERDAFVPTLRTRLAALRRSGGPRVWLVLPAIENGPAAPWQRQEVRPLLRQAAREAGVDVLDLDSARRAAPDQPALGEFLELYLALANPTANKRGWRVVRASSAQESEGPAVQAIDGNPRTYWHTQYSPSVPRPPHELVVDLGEKRSFSGLNLLPRQDGGVNGRFGRFEVYVGDQIDALSGTPVVTGTGRSSPAPVRALFPRPVTARYVRVVILSEAQNGPWASLAELDLLPILPASSGGR